MKISVAENAFLMRHVRHEVGEQGRMIADSETNRKGWSTALARKPRAWQELTRDAIINSGGCDIGRVNLSLLMQIHAKIHCSRPKGDWPSE